MKISIVLSTAFLLLSDASYAVSSTAAPINTAPSTALTPTPTPGTGATTQSTTPDSGASSTDAVNNSSGGNGSSALSSTQLAISDQLHLITTTLWTGSIPFFGAGDSDGKGGTKSGHWLNVSLSSSLAESKPTGISDARYQDAENLLPTGGVLNLIFSPLATVDAGTYADAKSKVGDAKYGRAISADRWYFNTDSSNRFGKMAVDDLFTSKSMEAYVTDGIGAKLLNRNSDASTTSSDASDYGVAGTAYLGLGADGGLIPFDQSSADNFGNIRTEAYLEANYADGVSVQTMYPDAIAPKRLSFGAGGNFSFVIGSIASLNVQGMWPLGTSRRYMGKVILVSITFTRPQSSK